jgi:predicted anti-sigma-YlaC factor YlaD
MLTCKEATQLMSNDMDSGTTWHERNQLRLHLITCSGCRNYRRDLHVLRRACRALVGRTVGDDTSGE